MPTYQYACTQCHEELEAVQSFSDAALTECPVCGGRLRKVFSAVGVVFKGSGFYKNDSRAGSSSGGQGSGSGDKGGDKPSGDKGGEGSTGDKGARKDSAPTAASSGSGGSSSSSGTGSSAPAAKSA